MPRFNFNFDDIPDNVPPEGEAEVVVEKVELKFGKDSGQPYLNWEFKITEGDYTNNKIWLITSLAENGLWRLKQLAEEMGFAGEFELEIDDETNLVIFPPFEGTALTVNLHHEEYQGRKQARISSVVDYHTTHHLEGSESADEEGWEEDDDEDEFEDFEELEDEEEEVLPPPKKGPGPRRNKK